MAEEYYPIQPGELAALMRNRLDNHLIARYQVVQRKLFRTKDPLLPPLDDMTEEERREAGLYEGYDPDLRPAHVSPVTWELYLRDRDKPPAEEGPACTSS